jgi:hypothetical protein
VFVIYKKVSLWGRPLFFSDILQSKQYIRAQSEHQ